MKRFLTLALAGALVLGMGSVAYANICAFDPVPAATLLFPFVAYNYDDGLASNGTTTLWSITNVSSERQIVHVTLWTDYSEPILDFNILLTGYDMQNWNIRDTLRDGLLPPTYSQVHTTQEGISEDGPWSRRNSIVAGMVTYTNPADPQSTQAFNTGSSTLGCDRNLNESYPGKYALQTIPANIRGLFQAWLQSSQTALRMFSDCNTPVPGLFNLIPSSWFESRTTADDTWMYLTMDVVDRCNKLFPDNSAYWGPVGVAQNQNVLVGDYSVVNFDQRFSEVDNAVHIEADPNIRNVATVSPNLSTEATTFYARYSNAYGVSDYREPLPTAWAVRYRNELLGDGTMLTTWLRVFKTNTRTAFQVVPDLQVVKAADGIQAARLYARVCLAYTYYTWDDEENVNIASTVPWSSPTGEEVVPNLLPLETQEVNADQFDLVGPNGWMMFVWPASNLATYAQVPVYYQTWMGVKYVKEGDFSGSRDAQVLANYNCFAQQILPGLGINFQYIYPFDGYVWSSNPAE